MVEYSLYEMLQILSISIFEEAPISKLFAETQLRYYEEHNYNQLTMWN